MRVLQLPQGWLLAGLLLLGLASANNGIAQQKPCTRPDEKSALIVVDQLRSWKAIYRAYERYGHCDDGAIPDGLSDYTRGVIRLSGYGASGGIHLGCSTRGAVGTRPYCLML